MRISSFYYQISYATVENRLSLSKAFETAVENGIQDIVLDAEWMESNIATETRIFLNNYGLSRSVYGAPICDFSSEEGYRAALSRFEGFIKMTEMVGAKHFMIVPRIDLQGKTAKRIKNETECIRNMFFDVSRLCVKYGICPTVENYSITDYPFTTISDIKWLLDNVPDLMFNIDTGNFTLVGEDEVEAARLFADKIVKAHIKDVKTVERSTLVRGGKCFDCAVLGTGETRNEEVLDILNKAGYNGELTIEVSQPYFERTLESAKWMKEVLKKYDN